MYIGNLTICSITWPVLTTSFELATTSLLLAIQTFMWLRWRLRIVYSRAEPLLIWPITYRCTQSIVLLPHEATQVNRCIKKSLRPEAMMHLQTVGWITATHCAFAGNGDHNSCRRCRIAGRTERRCSFHHGSREIWTQWRRCWVLYVTFATMDRIQFCRCVVSIAER